MSAERNSFSTTTFNRSGKLLQIEYANQVGMKGEPTVGIRATDGIIVATRKCNESKLAIPGTVVKVEDLGSGMALSYAGLRPDFRILVKRARAAGDKHYMRYGRRMTMRNIVNTVSTTMQEYCQASGFRPYGLSLMLAGWENNLTRLYHFDAEGSHVLYKALAIGERADERMDYLQRYYNRKITADFGICLALYAIQEGNVGPLLAEDFEIGICTEEDFKRLDQETLQSYIRDME